MKETITDPTLLCVDDEPSILSALRRMLRKEPVHVLTATNGAEALEVLEHHRVHVTVTDYRMPGMTGIELLQHIKDVYPSTVRVLLSGYADLKIVLDSINKGEVYRFLPKPWDEDELRVALRQCFAHHELQWQNLALLEQVSQQNEELQALNEELHDVNGQLENLVEQRTRSLQLAQEILEELPVPVIGLDQTGMVVLVNAAASDMLTMPFYPLGLNSGAVLPSDLIEAVEAFNADPSQSLVHPCRLNGHAYNVRISALKEGPSLRGCILIWEPHRS